MFHNDPPTVYVFCGSPQLSTYYISVSVSPAARLRSPYIGSAACLRKQGSRSAVFLYGC